MAVQILEVVQNTEEWSRLHDDRVSGSSADLLLTRGLDEALRQDFGSFNGNYYTKRGHILEDEAIEVYEAIHRVVVARVGFVINDKFPNAGCSPDGLDGHYLLEVKCFGEAKHLSIRNAKQIPFKIMAQLQFNMMITGLKKARLIMYNPDVADDKLAYCEIEVRANPAIFRNLKNKLARQ